MARVSKTPNIATVVQKRTNSDVESGYDTASVNTFDREFDDGDKPNAPEKIDLISMAEELAGDTYCITNFSPDGLYEAVNSDPYLSYVEKCFPHAQGGPLLIDEPLDSDELHSCAIKQPHLKKLGFRYLILTQDKKIEDAKQELAAMEAHS